MPQHIRRPDLRAELLTHTNNIRDRSDRTRFLVGLIAVHGWPGIRLVGADGAEAAFALAAEVPEPYQASWVAKVTSALTHGDVPSHRANAFLARVAAIRATS